MISLSKYNIDLFQFLLNESIEELCPAHFLDFYAYSMTLANWMSKNRLLNFTNHRSGWSTNFLWNFFHLGNAINFLDFVALFNWNCFIFNFWWMDTVFGLNFFAWSFDCFLFDYWSWMGNDMLVLNNRFVSMMIPSCFSFSFSNTIRTFMRRMSNNGSTFIFNYFFTNLVVFDRLWNYIFRFTDFFNPGSAFLGLNLLILDLTVGRNDGFRKTMYRCRGYNSFNNCWRCNVPSGMMEWCPS